MSVRDIVEFTSERFAPELPEESQVNPEVYGAELAFWLCRALATHDVVTTYPSSEDWGWFIEYFGEDESEFAIHCCNVEGSRQRWMLSLRAHARGLFGRNPPPLTLATPVLDGIRTVVAADSSIRDATWHLEW